MNKLFKAVMLSAMLGLLSACEPFSIAIGAGAVVGSMALEERGVTQAARDEITMVRLLKSISDHDVGLIKDVSLEIK